MHPVEERRRAKSMSRKQLADASDTALPTIERIETGLTANPQGATLDRIATALGVTAPDLQLEIAQHNHARALAEASA